MSDISIYNDKRNSSVHEISIIIVNWNTRDLLAKCLNSILQTAGDLTPEIIVVDNASTDDSLEMLRNNFPQVQLVENEHNVGFAGANNQGMALARGRYLLLLNSDAILQADNLQQVIQFIDERPEVGACGVKLLNSDGTFQGSYSDFPTHLSEFLMATTLGSKLVSPYYPSPQPKTREEPREVDWIGGAFILLRREVFEQVGGMDEQYWMYSEETDWCYRIKQAGWQIYYLPQVELIHLGGGSTRKRRSEMEAQLYKSKVRFFAKNYSPNSAKRLYTLFGLIFLAREILSRLMMLVMPAEEQKARWHYELRTARLVRDACAQALSEA